MNIIVCVKQVPDTTDVKIDPVTNTLVRQGVPSILNPWDGYALELALQLKEKHSAKVTVLSMGPQQAEATLRECLAVGADEAILLSDRAFGGADTLATSNALSAAIKKIGDYDLIMFGKQAIDGDTAQVGPEVAEILDIPQITYVYEINVEDKTIVAKRETEEGFEVIKTTLPAAVTAVKANELRLPSIKGKMAARKKEIPIITANDVDVDMEKIGLKGSPTQVVKVFSPPARGNAQIITMQEASEAAEIVINKLQSKYIL